MWSGRFRGPLDPEFERWQRSFPFDRRLIGEELAASAAWARALTRAGVFSESELASVTGGLSGMAEHAASPGYLEDEEAEDVHHFVEKRLAELIGDTALKLHTGRSRNEQIATDLRLFVRGSIDAAIAALADLAQALIEQASAAGDAVMPAYTHLQRAEPVLVAHWLLAYCEMFLRDAERLADCRKRVNLCPLGSGAIAGATIVVDRQAIARELGFAAPTANSMDATSDRDFALEFADALSIVGMHLSRWAEEHILFATQEYGFLHLPEAYATGSSAMPQKQNPDALELIRGKSGRVFGAATSVFVNLKGLPLAYNKDLQESQQPIFEAADAVLASLAIAAGFTRSVTATEAFDFARMRAACERGFMNAMAAATYLTGKGMPFRRAHEVIGKAVQQCVQRGCELLDLSLEELRGLAAEFDESFYAAVTVAAVVECHNVPGGTAMPQVRAALELARQRAGALLRRELKREEAHAHA